MSKSVLQISLVIPVKNEIDSLENLVKSIEAQTLQPEEVIIVDGGSTDGTIEIAEQIATKNPKFRLIKTSGASPGTGRNIGTENARCDWVAFTDAGICLRSDWLEKLAEKVYDSQEVDIVYGNYAPFINNYFEKIAALAYVPVQNAGVIRGITIASYLMKRKVWKTAGGFPNFRAAEDLMFMEAVEKHGFRSVSAPDAMIYWQLRPNLSSTFRRFVLYSKHNVWAGRQWQWHHQIAKQYLLIFPLFIFLAVFHNLWWLLGIPAWLAARTAIKIYRHKYEFGIKQLFNPMVFFGVMLLILTIDFATYIGWIQALLSKDKN